MASGQSHKAIYYICYLLAMLIFGTNGLLVAGIDLQGGVIFHTAVSPAGTGPTSSNKLEIEASIAPLSRGGIKLHLGKGKLKAETVAALKEYNAFYAVIPPVTALLESKVSSREVMAYPEEGMEAFHRLYVHEFPCVVAAVHGESIYD